MFGIFSGKRKGEDWSVAYSTPDPWEAEVVRVALLSESIRAKVKVTEGSKKDRKSLVSVPTAKLREAEMVIDRARLVISKKDDILAEQAKREKEVAHAPAERDTAEEPMTIEKLPDEEPILLAEKDGVGEIYHYEDSDLYELRLELEFYKKSHFMSAEEWEEFTDFSAQRQEFFILLKEKYPKLSSLIKEHKMRPHLLKLIEYSYGKSHPPKK